jgi:hypothetical protein
MKKIILIFALFFGVASMNAQEEKVQDSIKQGWTKAGNILATFNQSAFNNEWTFGGVGNMAANVLINYDFNYAKDDFIWDNKLIIDYGVNKNKGQENFTKNNDRLELNSLAGKKAKGYWYYSAFFNFKSQLDSGFIDDELGNSFKTSHFFSPAYFQAGPGFLWKKSDNFNINISPAAAKLILVSDDLAGTFGTEPGKTSRFEFGGAIRAYYKVDIMENISFENILNLYSNYLEDPLNIDVDYTANISMSINKYISTNLVFQAIYDDNANPRGFQIRETFGLGFNYNF